ncbi:Putative multidrug export ATP-binding/permease protein SAV1866 [Achromobacter spanius]|uniref:thiol reductant ABC exporter subunit CydC n=1 Tax=Achromobacter spanius TaxID=217203 RepID=UPI000C2C117E|nr:thiol reductant ABC exporter subunit CydC [Achromobacter spanius]AUA57370.1 thiol reductant ABC exporter subunit CydC [Achromobacter spanius]CAB3629429.1 Multidrug efflux ATP-binding/permease protein [Achromobacter spanius]SPT40136.1 Putative multidrug export ATP-binding/permease protein SAV1866 [Achromobacter denitrificans]VEE54923.1 Putative multidrug export ATP-binding/permease protein SAV1866 [Achromobacter spanius]
MYFDSRLWRLTAGLRAGMAGGIFLGLLALAAGIARYVFLGQLLARVFDGAPWQDWITPALCVGAMVLLRALFDHWRTVQANHTSAQIQQTLRGKLYDRIVALGPAWFANQRTGGVMLTVVDGVEQLQTFFGQYLPQVAIAAAAPFAIFAVIAFWDVPTALVFLVAALFALFGPMAVHMLDRRASQARTQALNAFGEDFLDAVQGLPTLKSYGQGKAWGRRLAARARSLSDNTFWVLSVSLLTRGISDLGVALGAALALTLGAWRVASGDMSVEALLIVLMAGTEIFRPLRDLRSVLHRGMLGQSAAVSIHALMDAQPLTPVPSTVLGTRNTAGHPAPNQLASAPLSPTIEFDNVAFSYTPERRAHQGLAFRIAAGERVGVVGPSGAGKSTIVRLLLRECVPQAGVIRVGGQDVNTLDTQTLLSQIALVSQDITLFHGTIDDNLRLGRPDATHEQVRAAARAANIDDFIMALPDGYATRIGERGLQLSGGQRQRVAIARALLRDAPILILDEALSSVDTENEALIQQALDRLMAGRTTLILAHRLASVIGADRSLVLDQGRVVEAGPHAQLMQARGLYYRLMHEQAEAHRNPSAGVAALATAPVLDAAKPDDADGDGGAQGSALRPLDADADQVGWRATLGTLLSVVKPWRGTLTATILLGVARVAAFIGVGVFSALIVAAIRDGREVSALIIGLLICAPLAALFHWLESWLAHAMAYQLLADMRVKLFDKLERLAPAYLLQRRSGDLVALATQDIEMVEYFYAHTIAPAIVSVLVPLSVLGFLGVYSWPVALALLPFLAYALVSPVRGRRHIDALGDKARQALGEMSAHTTDTIQGLADLTAFQATDRRRGQFLKVADQYRIRRLDILRDLSKQTAWFEVAMGLGGLAVAVVGALQVSAGALSASMLPLLVLIAMATFLPVSEISQVSRQLADTIAATRRLHVVSNEPEPVTDGPLAPPVATHGLSLAFEHVSFAYPGKQEDTLKDLSFKAPAGATVAIVGASGAGKSTVASLLLRFWDPRQGAVKLDGLDVRQLQLDGLRERVALVTQDTYLFNDTLEGNIRLARPEATPEELARALDQAALTAFVRQLPDGLATKVGERGMQLSGGQRQRISIARAFLKNAPVLILDEATSHLDTLSEMQVRTALDALMQHRTTLVIAHRLSTIRNADLILVLDRGTLAEAGTHDQLLRKQGAYARLASHQGGYTVSSATSQPT